MSRRRPNRALRLATAALAAALLASACAVLVGQTGAGALAHADTQASWSSAVAFPSYVTSMTGSTVAAGPTGTTLVGANIPLGDSSIAGLWSLTSSGLGDRTSTYVDSTSQQVQFLPNGDSIIVVWDATDDNTTFSYRSASGSGGGEVTVSGVVNAFAANDDELLVIQASGAGASATSYAIGADGAGFTQSGSTVQIFSDPVNQIWAALDSDGTAEVVVNAYTPDYSAGYLAEIARTSSGAWGEPAQVSVPLDADLGFMRAAVAPGGRMLLTMEQLGSAGDDPIGIYALVREPDAGVGPAQSLLSLGNPPSGGISAVVNWLAAAGPDGTLAVTAGGETCAAQNTSTDKVSTTTVWIAPAGGSFSSDTVPGSTLTASKEMTVTALAAGDGEAAIGLSTGVVTNSTSTGGGTWNDAACVAQSGQATTVQDSDSAVILGSGADDASAALGTVSVSAGPAGPTPLPSVSSAAIDPNGNATVIGYLDGTGTPDYATFGDVGAPATPVTTTTTTATTTTTTTTTTATTASSSGGGAGQGTTSTQATTPSAPVTETPAAVTKIVNPVVVIRANQTVDFTNGGTVPENVAIFEWMIYSALQNSQRGHTRMSKTRLVKIASKKVSVKPHAKVTVELHLSKAAQKLLTRNHRLAVELQIVTSAAGHRTTTVTKHLTLRHAQTKGG